MDKYKRTIIAAAVMVSTMLLLNFASRSESIKPNRSFDEFPMHIGEWSGSRGQFDQEIYDVLGVDDSILATYRSERKESVHLYVGFYQSQKEGDLIHSPKNCMPGSGWNITETSIETVDVKESRNQSKNINVIRLLLQQGNQKQLVLYWFQSRGRIISSEYMQKIWLVIDSITKHRTDGSFVRCIIPVVDSEEESLAVLKNFIKKIYPYLNEYIPS